MKTSGIYRLQFPSGHYYIGSSKDYVSRCRSHQNTMRRGCHDSSRVQAVYNKYGVLPIFGLITECEVSALEKCEQQLLDAYVGELLCLNISKCAEAPRRGVKGAPCTEEHKKYMRELMRKRVFTDEHRKRISDAKKGCSMAAALTPEAIAKSANSRIGKKPSLETREKIANKLRGHKPAFSKKVILLNNGQIFESAMAAERITGAAAVGRACRKGFSAGKFSDGTSMRWSFYDRFERKIYSLGIPGTQGCESELVK